MPLGSSPRPRSREDSARDRLANTARSVRREASRRARNDRRDDDDNRSTAAPEPSKPKVRTRSSSAGDTSALDRLLADRANRNGGYRSTILSDLYGIPQDGARATRSLQNFNGRQRTILGR